MPIQMDSYFKSRWTHKQGADGDIMFAILAAGYGKRMEPLTIHHLPKPMFPIGGSTPISEMWVRKAVECGVSEISMNLAVLGETIRNYYGRGTRFGADIRFVEEYVPSGTLGGVCKQALGADAKRVLEQEATIPFGAFQGSTIIVPSGDIVTNFNADLIERMYEIHKRKGSAFTMLLTPIPWEQRAEFGTVELENPEEMQGPISASGPIRKFIEKDPDSPSNLNNASVYMIEMELMRMLDPLRTEASVDVEAPFYDFGKHVFTAMLGELDYVRLPKDAVLWGIQYDGLWFDVGRKEDYLEVNRICMDGGVDIVLPYERFPWGYLGNNVSVDFSKVNIIPPVIIGHDCVIEDRATLGPYAVLGDGWIVESGARISNSVLWKTYAFTKDEGTMIPCEQRKVFVTNVVRQGAMIEESIVVGGSIEKDVFKKTVDVLEDGGLDMRAIDWVPGGPRI